MSVISDLSGRLEQDSVTRLITLAFTGLAALLIFWLVGAGVIYQWLYDGRIYQGVRLLGADLGAYRPEEARAELLHRYDAYARRPIILRAGQQEWQATPAQLGLRYDVDRSVQEAYRVGRRGSFVSQAMTQWQAAVQGYPLQEVGLEVDDATLQNYLKTLGPQITRAMRDATLVVQPDLSVKVISSSPGLELKVDQTAAIIRPQLLALSSSPVDLVIVEATPRLVEADLAEPKARAEHIISSPMELKYGDMTWTLDRKALASLVAFSRPSEEGAVLEAGLDGEKLAQFLTEVSRDIDQKPLDARFDFSSGTLKVLREGKNGLQLDVPKAVEMVQAQALTPVRTVVLPVAPIPPRVGTDYAEKLVSLNFIDSARTEYKVGAPERIWNIELAAKRLHGVVVPPGEVFSFNQEVGPTTLEADFKWGWAIASSGDKFSTVPSEAGGICQVATTLFQTVFWAGYAIEERMPHIYWISRYGQPPKGMKGLDATVDQIWDSKGQLQYQVDLKFRNNTDHPLLIQSHADGKQYLTFALYGTPPPWKVEIQDPKIDQVVPANTTPVLEVDPKAPPSQRMQIETAHDGFRATIVRKVTQQGQEPRMLNLVSVYKPARNVFLVGPGYQPPPAAPSERQVEPTSTPAAASATAVPPGSVPASAVPSPRTPAPTPRLLPPTPWPLPSPVPSPPPATKPAR